MRKTFWTFSLAIVRAPFPRGAVHPPVADSRGVARPPPAARPPVGTPVGSRPVRFAVTTRSRGRRDDALRDTSWRRHQGRGLHYLRTPNKNPDVPIQSQHSDRKNPPYGWRPNARARALHEVNEAAVMMELFDRARRCAVDPISLDGSGFTSRR